MGGLFPLPGRKLSRGGQVQCVSVFTFYDLKETDKKKKKKSRYQAQVVSRGKKKIARLPGVDVLFFLSMDININKSLYIHTWKEQHVLYLSICGTKTYPPCIASPATTLFPFPLFL